MDNLIRKSTHETLLTKDLKLGDYQRDLDMTRCKSYAADFNIDMMGTIMVSEREGAYYVIDGQHRVIVANLVKLDTVFCQVIKGMTYEEEAILFGKLNTKIKHLSTTSIFKAGVEGKKSEETEIAKILKNVGFKVGRAKADNTVVAILALNKVYRKYGSKHLFETLVLIKDIWNGKADSLNNKIITGVSEFIQIYKNENEFTSKVFVKQLKKVDPIMLVREAKTVISTNRTDIKMVTILFKYYNNRLRNKMVGKHY